MASTQSSMRYMQKCLTDSLQYRREACRFLADNNHAYLRWLYAVNTTRTQVSQDDKWAYEWISTYCAVDMLVTVTDTCCRCYCNRYLSDVGGEASHRVSAFSRHPHQRCEVCPSSPLSMSAGPSTFRLHNMRWDSDDDCSGRGVFSVSQPNTDSPSPGCSSRLLYCPLTIVHWLTCLARFRRFARYLFKKP